MVIFLDGHVSVLKHCNDHLFRHVCEQLGANLYCLRFQPETLCCEPNCRSPSVRSCAARVCIFGTSHNDATFCGLHPVPSTMKQVSNGSIGGSDFWKSTKCVVVDATSFLRHIFQRERPVEFENKRLCPTFCVEHVSTQPQIICCLSHEARSTEPVKLALPSHAFVNNWISKRFVKKHLGTQRECFHFVSERTKERVVSPTSFLNELFVEFLKPRTQSMLAPL